MMPKKQVGYTEQELFTKAQHLAITLGIESNSEEFRQAKAIMEAIVKLIAENNEKIAQDLAGGE